MKSPLFAPIRLLAVMASLIGTAHAQSESASIRLLAFSRVGDAREVIVAGPDGKPLDGKPLALPTEQLSPPMTVSSRSLVFQSPATSARPDPSEVTTLGTVTLPATGKDFILVFLPEAKDGKSPYRVDTVPLPAGGFGSGDHVFANYSGSNIGFVIGGEKVGVASGKSAVYHPKDAEGNRPIVGYWQKGAKWETAPFYSSRLIVQKGVRNLVLIVRNPKTGMPDFRGIADFVEAPVTAENR